VVAAVAAEPRGAGSDGGLGAVSVELAVAAVAGHSLVVVGGGKEANFAAGMGVGGVRIEVFAVGLVALLALVVLLLVVAAGVVVLPVV